MTPGPISEQTDPRDLEAQAISGEIMEAAEDAAIAIGQTDGDLVEATGIIAKAINDAVMAERERYEPAVRFSKEVLKGVFEGCDIDGFGAQELGVECGVLEKVAFDPKKHSDPDGLCEPGDWWFEYSGPLATPGHVSKHVHEFPSEV